MNLHKFKKVDTICNVYQFNYINKKVTGIGDFIRGCFFLIHFCEVHKLHFNIIFNHPISLFFKKTINSKIWKEYNILKKIQFFTNINYIGYKMDKEHNLYHIPDKKVIPDFFKYLNTSAVIDDNVCFTYVTSFPISIPTIIHKNKLNYLFEPSDEINKLIETQISSLNLTTNNFKIIHIRCGDNYLNEEKRNFEGEYLKKLYNYIDLIYHNDFEVLLLADNDAIKQYVINQYPLFKTIRNDIVHSCEESKMNNINIQNTMIDFYLFSHSSEIFSFTSYRHGSGFSKWCSEIYNIPYSCKFIEL